MGDHVQPVPALGQVGDLVWLGAMLLKAGAREPAVTAEVLQRLREAQALLGEVIAMVERYAVEPR